MNEALPPDLAGGLAGALGTLRHALADPLSAAGLKLELVERRLGAVAANGASLAEKLQGARADLAHAGRLIDLLPRLASIAGEAQRETSIGELCRVAGVPLEEEAPSGQRLLLRRQTTLDALRVVLWLLRSRDRGGAPPRVRATTASGCVSLLVEALGECYGYGGADLERPSRLARGDERAEELFLVRTGVEADGGRLELAEREGRLVAILSWPSLQPAVTPHEGGTA